MKPRTFAPTGMTGSREIVAEDERESVAEDLPELTQADLLIELIEAGGLDLDEHVRGPTVGSATSASCNGCPYLVTTNAFIDVLRLIKVECTRK